MERTSDEKFNPQRVTKDSLALPKKVDENAVCGTGKTPTVGRTCESKLGCEIGMDLINEPVWSFGEAKTTTMVLMSKDYRTIVHAHIMHIPNPWKGSVNSSIEKMEEIKESILRQSGQVVKRADNLEKLRATLLKTSDERKRRSRMPSPRKQICKVKTYANYCRKKSDGKGNIEVKNATIKKDTLSNKIGSRSNREELIQKMRWKDTINSTDPKENTDGTLWEDVSEGADPEEKIEDAHAENSANVAILNDPSMAVDDLKVKSASIIKKAEDGSESTLEHVDTVKNRTTEDSYISKDSSKDNSWDLPTISPASAKKKAPSPVASSNARLSDQKKRFAMLRKKTQFCNSASKSSPKKPFFESQREYLASLNQSSSDEDAGDV